VDSLNLNQLPKEYKALESFGFPNADLFSEKKFNSLLYRKIQFSIDIQSEVSSFSISTLFKEFICKSTLVESGSTETDFRKKPGVNCYSFAIGRIPKPIINNATLTDPIPGGLFIETLRLRCIDTLTSIGTSSVVSEYKFNKKFRFISSCRNLKLLFLAEQDKNINFKKPVVV